MEGPDHPFALEPDELRAMVAGIRDAQAALGDGRKDGPSRGGARGDVHDRPPQPDRHRATCPPGPCSRRDMITVKRPGFGIAPKHLELVSAAR